MNSVTRKYDAAILKNKKDFEKNSMADSQQNGLSSVKIILLKEGRDKILIEF